MTAVALLGVLVAVVLLGLEVWVVGIGVLAWVVARGSIRGADLARAAAALVVSAASYVAIVTLIGRGLAR